VLLNSFNHEQERDLLSIQLAETGQKLQAAESKLSARSDDSAELRQELRQVEAALAKHKREAEKFSQTVEVLRVQSEKQTADALEVQTLRGERECAHRTIEALESELRAVESRLETKEKELVQRLEVR
jgi:predicted  nucleic acid-binding Zn-ribbon protein